MSFVPWNEIGSIRKRSTSSEIYNVFAPNGRRLAWFPLSKKTRPFFELARQHGIAAGEPKSAQTVWKTSCKRLNGTLGEWDVVLARSAYAKNDMISVAVFRGFMVALFMDKRLHDNNIIAINQDGTVRWKISDIVKQPEPISYAAMAAEGSDTISAMAVPGRRCGCVIYEIDVYEQRIVSRRSEVR